MKLTTHKPENKKFNRPLLFIHGMWHNESCWDETIDILVKNGFECHTFNLTKHGVGKKPKKMRMIGINTYVKDVVSAVNQLENPILIGHSMGGFLIEKYMEKHEALDAILLAPVPLSGTFRATLRFVKKYPLAFLKVNLTADMYPIIANENRFATLFLTEGSDASKYYSKTNNEAYRAYLDTMLFKLPKVSKINKNRGNAKLYLFIGDKDAFFSVKEEKKTAEKLNAECIVFEGSGHNLMNGVGLEKVVDKMIEVLNQM